ASREKEGSMLSVRDALMNFSSSYRDFLDAGGALRTEAGIVFDAMVNDPEWAELAPLAEQTRENILAFLNRFIDDAIPPELGEAMENSQEFAGE
ncbi:MAG TPA: hypothetical protein VLQ80_25475, partial [Candidatus Saccharimonadia bacterium]|nr:hypothetical protein [Candidatus Saccharimonadia bacterium]